MSRGVSKLGLKRDWISGIEFISWSKLPHLLKPDVVRGAVSDWCVSLSSPSSGLWTFYGVPLVWIDNRCLPTIGYKTTRFLFPSSPQNTLSAPFHLVRFPFLKKLNYKEAPPDSITIKYLTCPSSSEPIDFYRALVRLGQKVTPPLYNQIKGADQEQINARSVKQKAINTPSGFLSLDEKWLLWCYSSKHALTSPPWFSPSVWGRAPLKRSKQIINPISLQNQGQAISSRII